MNLVKRYMLVFLALLMVLTSNLAISRAQDQNSCSTSATLRVRTGPGTNYRVLTNFAAEIQVVAEGRNSDARWILARTPDGAIRGWAAAAYLACTLDIGTLPVSEEIVGAAPTVAPAEPVVSDPGVPTASTSSSTLNMRNGPGTGFGVVTRLAPRTSLILEGRNNAGDWVKVHTADNAFQGWVAARYIRLGSGVVVINLPVVEEVIPPSTDPATASGVVNVPSQAGVLSSGVIASSRTIFQRGQAMGNNPNVFIKIGDSTTAYSAFLCTAYNLGNYGYLSRTVNYFAGSNCAHSLTSEYGYSTATVLDPTWSNPNLCGGGESLLQCEIRRKKPSVAFIYIGLVDMAFSTADVYRNNLNTIVQTLTSNGVIPVMITVTSSDFTTAAQGVTDRPVRYNAIVREIANSFQVPFIDYQQAAHGLPNQGCIEEGYHLTSRNEYSVSFNGDELIYGKELRELMVLQVLHALRETVIG